MRSASLALLSLVANSNAQLLCRDTCTPYTTMWNGVEREYETIVPANGSDVFNGMVALFFPAPPLFIRGVAQEIANELGVIAVIPGPQILEGDSGKPEHEVSRFLQKDDDDWGGKEDDDWWGKDDDGGTYCWKSFENYGYCLGGETEDLEDIDFVRNVIQTVQRENDIAHGRVVAAGFSNGGSFTFRVHCELSDIVDGVVIGGQSWFDPIVGYYDYVLNQVPPGEAQCIPERKIPVYSVCGTADEIYGQLPYMPDGFESGEKWEIFSDEVLGCTGIPRPSTGPSYQGRNTTCYEYPECPLAFGVNKHCAVDGMTHDSGPFADMVSNGFKEFFN